MRRYSLLCLSLGSLALAGCSSSPSGWPEGPSASSEAPIVYGTSDTANPHSAVVALLIPSQGGHSVCAGTIVQVTSGIGYVLTAAHCCTPNPPSIVVLASDYTPGLNYVNDPASAAPPVYAVSAVAVDPEYVPFGQGNSVHDFCMFQFNAPAGTPAIPVAVGNDGVAVGAQVDYVGFGVTSDASKSNVLRNIAANETIDVAVDAQTFTYSEGAGVGGPCAGDSGGPALMPAGVPQSQQRVVGTTSYGGTQCEPAGSQGVDMRVTSATGPGGFISAYLGGTSSSGSSSGGAPTDCTQADGDFGCCTSDGVVYYCDNGTLTQQVCTGGQVCGWNASAGYYDCVAPPGGEDPSSTYPLLCQGPSSTSGGMASSSGGGSETSNGAPRNLPVGWRCGVAPGGPDGAPSVPASLAGLLLGAAIAVSRRRR